MPHKHKTGMWEPAIPLRAAEIYLLGVERWIAVLPPEAKTSREFLIVEGRTRFLRAWIAEMKAKV